MRSSFVERIAEARHLGPRAALEVRRLRPLQSPRTRTRWRLAVVQTPMTAAGSPGPEGVDLVSWSTGICNASVCTLTSAVELTPGMPFISPAAAAAGVVTGEAAQVTEVEDGTKVDVEALGPLPGEHLGRERSRPDRVDGGIGQRRVVRGRERSDVAGRAQEAGAQDDLRAFLHRFHWHVDAA